MRLQGIGRQSRQAVEATSPSEGPSQVEAGLFGQEPPRSFEAPQATLPFSETGFLKPLVARLLGGTASVPTSKDSPLTDNQSKLLLQILSVEMASAESALMNEMGGSGIPLDSASSLSDYQYHLLDRLAILESRLLDEMTELDGEIANRMDLLSGNEEENEGLSDVELEIKSLEKIREGLEADLETLSSLKTELTLEENDPVVLLESITGVAEDLLEVERVYLERDWDRALEGIQVVPEFAKLPYVQSQLELLTVPSLENFQALVFLQAQAELWTVTEARIEQFGQMMKTAGITDGIVNLGGLTQEDLTFAQEYNFRQSDYSKVLRFLTEGKAAEALELFRGLEESPETRILFETIQDAEKINACTVNALTVVGAGGLARLAMPVMRGLALMGNVSSKAITALQFGTQVGTFTVAHRKLDGWVMERPFFDPNLSPIQNAEALSQEFLINAGMFAFLGMSQKAFAAGEGKVLQGIANRRGTQASLKSYGPMTIEAEAASSLILQGLKRSPLRQLTHTAGSFGTELVGFGTWDYLSANVRALAQGDYEAKRVFAETLGSRDQWEHNLVFLTALKAGGALAAPVFRPMTRSAEGFARAKYQGRLGELDQSARDCVEALEGHLESPRDSLELLERYESALSAKAEFLRDLPSELSHPAGLAMLEGEIQNIRELGRAIRAGVFDTAANDGTYQAPPPRIGMVADPREEAANVGFDIKSSPAEMKMAVGAEEILPIGITDPLVRESSGPSSDRADSSSLRVFAMDSKGSGTGLWQRAVHVLRTFLAGDVGLRDGSQNAMREGSAAANGEVSGDFQKEFSGPEHLEAKMIASTGIYYFRDVEGAYWIGLGKSAEHSQISNFGDAFLCFSKFKVLNSPERVQQGQYSTISWFAELFSWEGMSNMRVLDLSDWNLESRWVRSIRTLAFSHPNLKLLEEIRVGREVLRPSESERRLREKLLEFWEGDLDEIEGEGEALLDSFVFADEDAHPFLRIESLREAHLEEISFIGSLGYQNRYFEVLEVFLDPTVSRLAMSDSVRPLRLPGGYPHALRMEAARIYVEAVELSGSAELAEAGAKAFWKVLDKPRVVPDYGVPRQESAAVETQVRRDLFPLLVRLLPYLPTDSTEVTNGFLMLERAEWLRDWDETSVTTFRSAQRAFEKEDSIYRHDGQPHPALTDGFVPVGLAYAYYLEAASPYQLELSIPVRRNAGYWLSGLLLAAENGHPEALRALTIWVRQDPWAAQVIDSLSPEGEIRRSLEAPWRETDRIAARRLHELTEKRKAELESTWVGVWVKIMFPDALSKPLALPKGEDK